VTKVESDRIVLMERCPLCGKGRVEQVTEKEPGRHDAPPAYCLNCGATFQSTVSGGIELIRCEPDLLARALELESPTACRRCRHCLQGVSFYEGEWKKLSERGWVVRQPSVATGRDSTATGRDSTPSTQHSVLPLGIELADGEEIRLEVSPVYLGEELLGLESTAAKVLLTSLRLILLEGDNAHFVPLENIAAVEERKPGLWIQLVGSLAPIYLFAPPPSDALSRLKLKLNGKEEP